MNQKVLIVEDDPDIADLIRVNLEEIGLNTAHESNGKEGLELGLTGNFDLLLLDIMLPELSGLDICREIRTKNPKQAILMLTAKNSEMDRVLGLELGADDYMTKPFSVRELQARVRSHLRRNQAYKDIEIIEDEKDLIVLGGLSIDLKQHQIMLNGKNLDLTSTEFDLLHHFSKYPNQVFGRAQLLESVWGYHHSGYEHTVNSHINRLRAKIEEDATDPKIVQTVWGVGYRLNLEALIN